MLAQTIETNELLQIPIPIPDIHILLSFKQITQTKWFQNVYNNFYEIKIVLKWAIKNFIINVGVTIIGNWIQIYRITYTTMSYKYYFTINTIRKNNNLHHSKQLILQVILQSINNNNYYYHYYYLTNTRRFAGENN